VEAPLGALLRAVTAPLSLRDHFGMSDPINWAFDPASSSQLHALDRETDATLVFLAALSDRQATFRSVARRPPRQLPARVDGYGMHPIHLCRTCRAPTRLALVIATRITLAGVVVVA
jgi:hypothetical protein